MVELANLLEYLLDVLVVLQPLTHLRHEFGAQAELAHVTTGIGDGENTQRMSLTAGAPGAFAAMGSNAPMKEGTTQDLASDRQAIKEPLARTEGLFVYQFL